MSQFDTSTTNTTSSGSYGSTLSAFFDERDDAQEAVQKLRDLGIETGSIRLTEGSTSAGQPAGRERHRGFFDALANFFMPEEDRYTYAEGLNRGGYLVTVTNVPTGLYDRALDILDDEGAINIDERADSWRSEGWTGYPRSDSAERTGTYTAGSGMGTGTGATGYSDTGMSDRRDELVAGEDEAIPVVEEQLRVGKRDVSHGRVRVRAYTVEEPVNEEVNLRDERVVVERRPVDRTLSGTEAAFQDRTIEAEERAEEAVVDKQARVVEEVSLRKEAEDRTETVSDTVRHTEVEVEDERDNKLGTDRTRSGM